MTLLARNALSIAVALSLCVLPQGAEASNVSGGSPVVIVVQTLPTTGGCPDVGKVRRAWRQAFAAFQGGDRATALRLVTEAYRRFPRSTTAYKVGAYHERSGDLQSAFEWYLTARNYWPRPSTERKIIRALRRTGGKAGYGVIRVKTGAGGVIDIDGTHTARNGAWFAVRQGVHKLAARRAGGFGSQTVTVKAGDIRTTTLAASQLPATKSTLTAVHKAKPAAASIRLPLGLILGGLAVAKTGALFHVWGLDLAGDAAAANKLDRGLVPPGQLARPDGSEQKIVAGVMYGLGAAAILSGAIVWATLDSGDAASPDALALNPTFGVQGAGLSLSGSF